MTYGLYSIRDVKVGWLTPTMDSTDESAIRNFAFAVQKNDIFRFSPNDFALYRVGIFDMDTGKMSGLSVPVLLIEGTDAFSYSGGDDL